MITDALIAPAFPSNTARGGVLFPIVLSVARGSGLEGGGPRGSTARRLPDVLRDGEPGRLVGPLDDRDVGQSDRHPGRAGVRADDRVRELAPRRLGAAMIAILLLPCVVARLFPPGVGVTPDAPVAARKALAALGPLSRDERITAVAFALMVSGWIFADKLGLNVTAVAFGGLGLILMTNVLTLDDIATKGDTLATFLWLAVPFALSGQLNELGFMAWAGQRLAAQIGGLSWPLTYVTLVPLYVAIHFMFVSQSSQVLALLGRLPRRRHPRRCARAADGVRAALREQLLLRDHAAGRKPERDLRRQRLPDAARALPARFPPTLFFLAVFLVIGTAWLLLVTD